MNARATPGKLLAVGVGIDLAVLVAPLPELLSYPTYTGGLMHYPAFARIFAICAAIVSLACLPWLSITAMRRSTSARSRGLAILASVAASLPLPLHLIELWLLGRVLDLHFFWR